MDMTTNTTPAPTVETYKLVAANGRPIRTATRVTLATGETIEFTERMTKRDALRAAAAELARRG